MKVLATVAPVQATKLVTEGYAELRTGDLLTVKKLQAEAVADNYQIEVAVFHGMNATVYHCVVWDSAIWKPVWGIEVIETGGGILTSVKVEGNQLHLIPQAKRE